MKITFQTSRCRNQHGSAVLIVIILLGVMLAFIAGNTANLNQLKREMNLIEQKQLKRGHATKPAADKVNPAQP